MNSSYDKGSQDDTQVLSIIIIHDHAIRSINVKAGLATQSLNIPHYCTLLLILSLTTSNWRELFFRY